MQPSEVAELRELVIEGARHVFPSCGIEIGDAFEPTDDDKSEAKLLVAFMGFTGEILRGTLSLVAPIELMRKAYPLVLNDPNRWEIDVFDWSGEVANRLLGRIKQGLEARGVEVEPSTPRVMLGEHLHVTRSVRGTVCSTCFTSGASWIKVWFDAVAPEGAVVFASPSRATETPPEGDVLLF